MIWGNLFTVLMAVSTMMTSAKLLALNSFFISLLKTLPKTMTERKYD
jgi:hypothetical protein